MLKWVIVLSIFRKIKTMADPTVESIVCVSTKLIEKKEKLDFSKTEFSFHADLIRCTAIFMVVLLHAAVEPYPPPAVVDQLVAIRWWSILRRSWSRWRPAHVPMRFDECWPGHLPLAIVDWLPEGDDFAAIAVIPNGSFFHGRSGVAPVTRNAVASVGTDTAALVLQLQSSQEFSRLHVS